VEQGHNEHAVGGQFRWFHCNATLDEQYKRPLRQPFWRTAEPGAVPSTHTHVHQQGQFNMNCKIIALSVLLIAAPAFGEFVLARTPSKARTTLASAALGLHCIILTHLYVFLCVFQHLQQSHDISRFPHQPCLSRERLAIAAVTPTTGTPQLQWPRPVPTFTPLLHFKPFAPILAKAENPAAAVAAPVPVPAATPKLEAPKIMVPITEKIVFRQPEQQQPAPRQPAPQQLAPQQPAAPKQQPQQQQKFATCTEVADKIPGYSFTSQALAQCPDLLALQQDPNVAKTFFIPSDKVGDVSTLWHAAFQTGITVCAAILCTECQQCCSQPCSVVLCIACES
jgi:hypothetical protein